MIRTTHTHPIRGAANPVHNGLLGLTFCHGNHAGSLNRVVHLLISRTFDAYSEAAR
jgi:hypothetical protein